MNRKAVKILITGANGFIGSHLLRRFSMVNGLQVYGMVRRSSDLSRLKGGSYDLRYASLNDPLEDIVRGCDVVIHTAARSSDWGKKESFFRTNVDGTVNLVRASIKMGVRRLIYFSSTVVYGFQGNYLTGEDRPSVPFKHPYCLSKVEAERELYRYRDGIFLVILRPSNVFGPGDLTTTYPLLSALQKGLAAFPDGGRHLTSLCYIENLIRATELTLDAECLSGEAFNISDGNDMPWRKFLSLLAVELDVAPPRVALPGNLLRITAWGMEKLYMFFNSGSPPVITPYRIAQVVKDYSFSIEKAKKRLGYLPPCSTGDGILKSVRWFKEYHNR